jgi:hypothetical protein
VAADADSSMDTIERTITNDTLSFILRLRCLP